MKPKKIKQPIVVGPPKNRTAEEAKRLSISQDLLLNLYTKGIIPGVRLSKRIVLFDPVKVDGALERIGGGALEDL